MYWLTMFLHGVVIGTCIFFVPKEVVLYNCIYYYSVLQMCITRMCKLYILTNYYSNTNKKRIEIINNNGDVESVVHIPSVMTVSPFIISTYVIGNHRFCQIMSGGGGIDVQFQFEKMDEAHHFILVEIMLNNIDYKIDLKPNEDSFYVATNFLDKRFFMYYLKHYMKEKVTINNDLPCSLKIIDSNINIITLDLNEKENGVLLGKDTYTIIRKNAMEEEEQKSDSEKDFDVLQ